jgi:hypothetical protein
MTDAPDPDPTNDDGSLDDDSLDDDSLDDAELATGTHQATSALGVAAGGGDATVEAYDLDDDGKVSIVEGARAQLGVLDAELAQTAEQGGLKGKLAGAAHHLLDKLDNDDPDPSEPDDAPTA